MHQDWVDQITDDYPALMEAIESARFAHSDGMGAYMCFMAVRLMEMHRVLKPTGSLYLHCDPTASHYLKAVLDAIFGYRRFRNEIVWCYRGGGVPKTAFARKHDLIFSYSKGGTVTFNRQYVPYSDASQALVRGRGGVGIDGRKRDLERGASMPDWWTDINSLQTWSPERKGYPTQKPLALYERVIRASSNEGDVVLDPFCGCATTPIAAERLQRQWIGMDIWDGALEVVKQRLRDNLQLLTDIPEIHYTTKAPARTDAGESAAPFLRVKERVAEPDGPRWSRAQMYDFLLEQNGSVCQGCDRRFDDPRYLELDHNTPRADGGLNHVSNRVLLCGPCNRLKSNIYTLSGLRRENSKRGYMATS